jgi:pimeloyl-ACP methyl ester carboxylesterase
VKLNRRPVGCELAHDLWENAIRKALIHPDSDGSKFAASERSKIRICRTQTSFYGGRMRDKQVAGLGELNCPAPSRALDQSLSSECFEGGNLITERGMRRIQVLRGLPEGARLSNSQEGQQLPEPDRGQNIRHFGILCQIFPLLQELGPQHTASNRRNRARMAAYVDLDGVRTWYDVTGAGDPLVLLHPGGGGVDSRAFAPNLDALAAHFHTFTPDRRGHGRTPDVAGPITYELMVQDTIRFLERVVGGPARLLGCSDGAVVALIVSLRRPDLVSRLVLVAGVFHRDGWVPQAIDPTIPAPEALAESYADVSPDGAAHYPVVAEKLVRMHVAEPTLTTGALAGLRCRTLVMVGDDDEVTLEHAVAMYRGIPDAELAVVPGTSHGLLVEKPELCNAMIVDFLSNDPVETIAPIRRAASGE